MRVAIEYTAMPAQHYAGSWAVALHNCTWQLQLQLQLTHQLEHGVKKALKSHSVFVLGSDLQHHSQDSTTTGVKR